MIVVVDYEAGNLYNVGNALAYLGVDFVFSGDPERVARASKVILPGVGSARAAMDSLRDQGLVPVIQRLQVPFLGICLGLQILFDVSDEEDTPCLGVMDGRVRSFDDSRVKVPHIGWNQIRRSGAFPAEAGAGRLLDGIPEGCYFYFVHSYYAPSASAETVAVTDYSGSFASMVSRKNFWGVQFHPERSGEPGLRVLRNFVAVDEPCS